MQVPLNYNTLVNNCLMKQLKLVNETTYSRNIEYVLLCVDKS